MGEEFESRAQGGIKGGTHGGGDEKSIGGLGRCGGNITTLAGRGLGSCWGRG